MDISDDNDQQNTPVQQQLIFSPSVFPQDNSIGVENCPPNASDFDIDSLLLQKFNCLGTTDHDDLIKQFQIIMNNQINSETARFFLEMSNW